jgi:aspartyl-tRNA(Asn)/glutamyl-tRNA(Gln) amidotransferase subunit C
MIDKKEVYHLLELSRLEISESEKKDLQKDLGSILTYIDQLTEVDTSNVEPMSGGTFNTNEYRKEDFEQKDFNKESLIEAAPKKQDGQFEIKNIF